MIHSTAKQTNLLALSAAIDAFRASQARSGVEQVGQVVLARRQIDNSVTVTGVMNRHIANDAGKEA